MPITNISKFIFLFPIQQILGDNSSLLSSQACRCSVYAANRKSHYGVCLAPGTVICAWVTITPFPRLAHRLFPSVPTDLMLRQNIKFICYDCHAHSRVSSDSKAFSFAGLTSMHWNRETDTFGLRLLGKTRSYKISNHYAGYKWQCFFFPILKVYVKVDRILRSSLSMFGSV